MRARKIKSLVCAIIVLSMSSASAFASDVGNSGNQAALLPDFNIELGNVPAEYIPNSEITFDSKGTFSLTNVVKAIPAPASGTSNTGVEIGGNLADSDPRAFEIRNAEAQRILENLPIYTYEAYYVAGDGAVALYDQDGQLIRVRGEHKYYSTLDQYKVNGVLPDGTYKGNFGQFSISTTLSFSSTSNYWVYRY